MQPRLWWLGLAVVLVLSGIVIRKALRSGAATFAVYGVACGALGVVCAIVQLHDYSALTPLLILIVVLAAAGVLRHLHMRLQRVHP